MSSFSFQSPPSFESPPIDELVFGIWFQQIEHMIVPYWGVLWERYKPEYALCEQHQRLGLLPTGPTIKVPLDDPRVWFVHPDGNTLIQVQSDAFFFNWRRKTPEDIYPGFSTGFNTLLSKFEIFHAFIEEKQWGPVKPVLYDLSYIDVIPLTQNRDTMAELGHYFPDFSWRDGRPAFLSDPLVNWQTHFSMPDEMGQLRVSMVSAHRKSDQQPVIRLEMNARGISEDDDLKGMSVWFERTHELMIEAFSYFTSREAQKEKWKLHE